MYFHKFHPRNVTLSFKRFLRFIARLYDILFFYSNNLRGRNLKTFDIKYLESYFVFGSDINHATSRDLRSTKRESKSPDPVIIEVLLSEFATHQLISGNVVSLTADRNSFVTSCVNCN